MYLKLTFRLFFIFLKTKMKKIKNFYQKIQLFQGRLIITKSFFGTLGKLQEKSDPLRLIQSPCISDKMFQSLEDSIIRFEKIISFYFKK